MFRKVLLAISLAASMAITFEGATAHAGDNSECLLTSLKATQVVPYRVEERVGGRGAYYRLAGAKVFVPARPGLTAEWIGANVERHLHEMKSAGMPGCPFAVSSVKVSVASGGTGYWVRIAGKDAKSAQEILTRAQRLVR